MQAQTTQPALLYLSAKAGPNQGWQTSATKGAAITAWTRNVGATRGSSYISVGGVNLTSDSDYAEWGAVTNPTTAKGLQRITFWLNSNMPVGATTISVTVNGVTSASLPFTIDNTGVIRFVSQASGNDSWDGQYPDHSAGGSHGPWKTPFMYGVRSGTGPGMFLYLRGETYTLIFDPSSGHSDMAYIGYFEEGGTNCTVYYPTIDGTDALRYTVTSYPGEMAIFGNVSIYNMSSYWTIANIRWSGSYDGYTMGNEWSHCADCQRHSIGLDMIGTEWIGANHHVINAFGDNFRILANYLNTTPVASGGYDATTSYPLYLSAGTTRLVKDNEVHGGGMYSIHNYDEPRCAAADLNRYMVDQVFDSNLLDITRASSNGVDMRAGLITGEDISGNAVTNITIKNNVVYSRDNLVSESCFKLFSETPTTLNGIHYYNNTCYNAPAGLSVIYSSTSHYKNVDLKNNIFSNIASYEINVDGGSSVDINPVFQYNLVEQTPRFTGNATSSNNIIGQPDFVSVPTNLHLQSNSPAVDAGTTLASVTADFDGAARPAGTAYDIGAYEYRANSSDVTPPTVSITAPANSATVSGTAVSVTANASDNVGVVGVQFKLDGANLGSEDALSPYGITWNTTSTSNGTHTLTAVARDAAGNNTTSSSITVTVNNADSTPPSVSVTAPAAGRTVSGTAVAVTATASDNVGVVGVQFKLDGANLGSEDLTSPYTITWNTTASANGLHSLTAVARDAAGNTTTSSAVSVTVNNVGNVSISIGTAPSGLSFSVDGTAYSSAQTFQWNAGTSHTIATTAMQASLVSGNQYSFRSWSDTGAVSHTITVPASSTAYTANFDYLVVVFRGSRGSRSGVSAAVSPAPASKLLTTRTAALPVRRIYERPEIFKKMLETFWLR